MAVVSRAGRSAKERLSEDDDDGLQEEMSQPAGEPHLHDMKGTGTPVWSAGRAAIGQWRAAPHARAGGGRVGQNSDIRPLQIGCGRPQEEGNLASARPLGGAP